MARHRSLLRTVAALVVTGQLIGCTGWHVESLSPGEVVERQQPRAIRVQQRDGRREVVYAPEVRGDSLLGYQDWSARAEHRALALTDVKEVATRHLSPGRTAGLVLGIGAVVGVIVGLSNMQGLENWGQ